MTTSDIAATPAPATQERPDGPANVERARRFMAAWDQRPFAPAAVAAFAAPDYADHNRPQSDPALSDREVLIWLSTMLAGGFPDGRHEIILAEAAGDDRVIVYWRFTGTHQGPFFGIPETGRQVNFIGTDLLTFRDGTIVEHRHVEELYLAFAQLGIVGNA